MSVPIVRVGALKWFAALASLSVLAVTATIASADEWWLPVAQTTVAAESAPRLEPFEATGLPSGQVRGIPQRATLPPGYNLKHAHGGPTYVYVLGGSLSVTDADGSQTYRAGDFFWEPVGRTHTAETSEGAELFILRFLAPRAEATIPVQ